MIFQSVNAFSIMSRICLMVWLLICGCKVERTMLAWPVGFTGRSGYVDTSGRWVIKPSQKYPNKGPFYERLAAVQVKKGYEGDSAKWGYIDTREKMVIKPAYESASRFSEGLAAVKWNGKYGYIDRKGRLMIPFTFDDAANFHNGQASVSVDSAWGLIDLKGQWIIKPFSNSSLSFNAPDNVSAFEMDGQFGFVDMQGRVLISPQFGYAESFSNGLALVSSDRSKAAFIDRSGDTVFQRIFSSASRGFKNGLAPVQDYGSHHYYYIDTNGRDSFDKRFSHAQKFDNELAIIILDGLYGVINKNGDYVLPPVYPQLIREEYNFFRVGILPDSIINAQGKTTWRPKPVKY